MVLNMPLNEIWNRKKRNNYFPNWNLGLAYAYFFHWFQAGYSCKRYAGKKKKKKKHVLQDNFGECYCLIYSGDKLSGICPEFPKISPIKLSSAEIKRNYPDIAEFQINTLIIKSLELSLHAALAKISDFSYTFHRALCFAWKKTAVNYIRIDEKFWDHGWYFAISAAVFGNVINSIASSKSGLWNVIKFKEQLNKKKLLAKAFSFYYMQGGCRKVKRLWVKDTQAMWNMFKLVVLHYDRWKYSM